MFESSNRMTLLSKSDYTKLTRLIAKSDNKEMGYGKGHPKLDAAVVVDDHMLPNDMAKIGSLISLKDLGTGSVARFILSDKCNHQQSDRSELRLVSVTSSLGIALLGARVGEQIKWTLPNGHTRYLRISELSDYAAVC